MPSTSTLLRRVALLTAALLAAAGIAGTASASAAQTAGVQLHLLWSDVTPAQMDAQLDRARSANAGLVRIDLGWSSLEQDGKGAWSGWYLGLIDAVVEKAQARGLKVLFSVAWTPCWASSAPETLKQGCAGAWWSRGVQYYPPSNPADYGDALAFLVRRYGGRVAAWELWNEPNSDFYLKAPDKAASYAAMVKAAYPAAKHADPAAFVIAGSVSNADAPFVEALYQQGIGGNFDAFSIHPYNGDRDPAALLKAADARFTFTQGVPLVHEVLAGHGDGGKPLWLTEFGWSTSTSRDGSTYENGVDESTQADYLVKAFRQMQSWSYVTVGVWYELIDMGSDRADWLSNLGLLRQDYSEKPALGAFRAASATLAAGTPPAGHTSAAQATTPAPRRAAKRRRAVSRLQIRLRRARGRVYAVGRSSRAGTVIVRLYRSRGAHTAARAYRLRIRVARPGRFVSRLRPRALLRGRWRAVATLTGRPIARARATIA